jgi:hypothetical protein
MVHGTRSQVLDLSGLAVEQLHVIQQEDTYNNGQAIGCCLFSRRKEWGKRNTHVNPLHLHVISTTWAVTQ